MAADRALIEEIRSGLAGAADADKAPGMQAYMKSSMPYYGVTTPVGRRLAKATFRRYPLASFADWHDTALTLWREATFREERYAALELTGYRPYLKHLSLAALPLCEEFVVAGAWWDYVDVVAIHRIGPILAAHPSEMASRLRAWSHDTDMWKRRSAILSQVAFKSGTDLDLLYDCIEPNLADREFFIRKAIGWALRSYAWVDAGEVVRYVESVGDRISPLSRREALKNVT